MGRQGMKDIRIKYFRSGWCLMAAGILVITGTHAWAVMQGTCPDCHTMHNSQGGAAMTFDDSSTPNEALLKGDCLGCHAQGEAQAKIQLSGGDEIPQVYHTDTTDLAAGNFAYITGSKGSGASNAKGHNIAGLTGTDGVLYAPPGGIIQFSHTDGSNVNTDNLACAGTNGCHGHRLPDGYGDGFTSPLEAVKGAHHNNAGGQLDEANSTGDSYRFLARVKGYESSDWEFNATASNHNEYFARTEPVKLSCNSGDLSCHEPAFGGPVYPPDGTMSQFCATCHGNFHTLSTGDGSPDNEFDYGDNDGIGADSIHPFIRHPSDLVLPDDSAEDHVEYSNYNNNSGYNLQAPVARTGSVPATSTSTVTPGSDAVMCLSCHRAHGSDYPDMLRWDYSGMIVGDNDTPDAGTGCFVCHTAKDDEM